MFIDDVLFGPTQNNADTMFPDLMPNDIDRIEVLSGPRSALYRASAMAQSRIA